MMNRSFRNLQLLGIFCSLCPRSLRWTRHGPDLPRHHLGKCHGLIGSANLGATVTIKNVDTGLIRTVTTSEDGSYSAPELPIGNYSVTVEKAGFK